MHVAKTTARFTAGLLLLTTLIVPALAVTGTVNSGDATLRVRSEANTDSNILIKLNSGTQVEVLSTVKNGWYQIAFDSITGYVSSDYLVVNEAQNAVTAVSSVSPATAVAARSSAVPAPALRYGKVIASSLNIRSGPSSDYDKVGSLRVGNVVEITSESNGWYQIESGYVSSDYVTIVDAAEAARSSRGQEIADLARTFVGYPYVYGGSSPRGFDCSGFARYILNQFGYSISRTASGQMDSGTSISINELQPGDLVFFKKAGSGSKRASHVGIYVGGNQFVHASTASVGVIVSNMSDAYYTSGFVGGRRLA